MSEDENVLSRSTRTINLRNSWKCHFFVVYSDAALHVAIPPKLRSHFRANYNLFSQQNYA